MILHDGCTSKPDTAYVIFLQRTDIEIQINLRDTLLCSGNNLCYKAKVSGGDPSKYQWQWKDMTHNNILSAKDSLVPKATQNTKIQLTLKNGCLADTNTFNIFVNPPLKASILTDKGKLNDTMVCFNQSLKLYSSGKGGTGTGYNFKGYLDKTLISNNDTLHYNIFDNFLKSGGTKTLKLVLNDNCTKDADSVIKTIKVI